MKFTRRRNNLLMCTINVPMQVGRDQLFAMGMAVEHHTLVPTSRREWLALARKQGAVYGYSLCYYSEEDADQFFTPAVRDAHALAVNNSLDKCFPELKQENTP